MSTLITGFGPFDGGSNASEALVRALAERTPRLETLTGGHVTTRILPVDTEQAATLLDDALAEAKPSRVLLIGQAAGRNRLSFERIATNQRTFRTPDCAGVMLSNAKVCEGGPERHHANWPALEEMIASLNRAGIPTEISNDCGTHLCNQLLYLALDRLSPERQSYVVTFLHIPLLPQQVIDNEPAAARITHCPYMPLDMMIRGVEVFLEKSASLGVAA